jgi:hypothetical protein
MGMKTIELTKGYQALVDDEDFNRVNKLSWRAGVQSHTIYARASKYLGNQKWRTICMSRFILNVTNPKVQVDHIDGNGLNNTRSNLRICTHQQNTQNKRKPRLNSKGQIPSSIYKGVRFQKYNKKWNALIETHGKCIYIGCFNTEIEAAKAYNNKAQELFGDFARKNEV